MKIDKTQCIIEFDACRSAQTVQSLQNRFENELKKDDLIHILSIIVESFDSYRFKLSNEAWFLHLQPMVQKSNSVGKSQFAEVLAKIFAEKSNRALILEILTPEEQTLWERVLIQRFVSHKTAEQILSTKVLKKNTRKSYYYFSSQDIELIPRLKWFDLSARYFWTQKEYYIFLPAVLRDLFKDEFAVSWSALLPAPSAEAEILKMNCESDTLTIIPAIKSLYLQGQLESGRYRILPTVVGRMAKTLKLGEFLPEGSDKVVRTLRTMLLLNMIVTSLRSNAQIIDSSPHENVRHIFDCLDSSICDLAGTLLFFIDKHNQRNVTDTFIRESVPAIISEIKKTDGEWTDISTLFDSLYNHPLSFELMTFYPLRVITHYTIINRQSGHLISEANMVNEVGIPSVFSVIGLLTAVGVVEIEYFTVDDMAPSPLLGIKRLRLTELGKYALRLTDNYNPAEGPTSDSFFELDSNHLMLRALGDNNPFEGMLYEYTREVGPRRYVADAKLILKGCSSRNDLEKKIRNFHRIIAPNPPDNWKEFFNTLLSNTDCLTPEENIYTILRVASDAHDLHTLIATDPVIKSLVIRAEGYRIIVERSNLDKLRKRLLEFNYLT
ncbi:MAG: hypothetical protein J1E29_05135 [Duncaniella sp.]|nr:hypothetical protein [Duncaniella sp.]